MDVSICLTLWSSDPHLTSLSLVCCSFLKYYDYHIYSQFTIKLRNLKQRENLLQYLKSKEINVSVFYPKPLHIQECFEYLNYKLGDFPISESIGNRVISLPVYPELLTKELNLQLFQCLET